MNTQQVVDFIEQTVSGFIKPIRPLADRHAAFKTHEDRPPQETVQTHEERRTLLLTLLENDPALFLERYGSHLREEHLHEFDSNSEYAVTYWKNYHRTHKRYEQQRESEQQIRQQQQQRQSERSRKMSKIRNGASVMSTTSTSSSSSNSTNGTTKTTSNSSTVTTSDLHSAACCADSTVRNRRFTRLQELLQQGEYFSLESMKDRAPSLYALYFGMPQPQSLQNDPQQLSQPKLSQLLLDTYDNLEMIRRVQSESVAFGLPRGRRRHFAEDQDESGMEDEDEQVDDEMADDEDQRDEEIKRLVREAKVLERRTRPPMSSKRDTAQKRMDEDEDQDEGSAAEDVNFGDDERSGSERATRNGTEPEQQLRNRVTALPKSGVQLRLNNEEEFRELMTQRFLSGSELDVDYANIDNDENLDDLQIIYRDAE
jgi:hypothetical protein